MTHFQDPCLSPELIRAAANRDAGAYETIYRAYQRPVYTLIRRLVASTAATDDIFQEVFVEILRSLGAYSGQGPLGAWIRSIAVSKCLMYLRSPWNRSQLWLDADTDEGSVVHASLADAAPSPDTQVPAAADLERALASLPALSRTVVWLHDVEGYTHAEIGRLLGYTTSFSKSQLARAHLRLRELLDPPDESLPCMPVSTNC
jgi:RNA polymerase sigma-70 factor (ECF subfamily)